jgi:hypothetical protein
MTPGENIKRILAKNNNKLSSFNTPYSQEFLLKHNFIEYKTTIIKQFTENMRKFLKFDAKNKELNPNVSTQFF